MSKKGRDRKRLQMQKDAPPSLISQLGDYRDVVPLSIDGETVSVVPLDRVVEQERSRAVKLVTELAEIVDAIHTVELLMYHIDTIAAVGRGALLRENLQGKAGKMSDAFTEYAMVADAYKMPIDSILQAWTTETIEGIRRALNENDDGEYLRQHAASHIEMFAASKKIRETVQKAGAKKQDAISWICGQAIAIWIDEGITQEDAAWQLYERLREKRDVLEGVELRAWEKLVAWENSDLVGNVWRNARRRGLLMNENRT